MHLSRTLSAAALAILTSLVGPGTARAAEPQARTVDGRRIPVEEGTVLVFWSLDCVRCGSDMAALEARGVSFLAVNTDGATIGSALQPYATLHGLEAPMVADTEGTLQRRFGVDGCEMVVVGRNNTVAQRQDGHLAAARIAAPEALDLPALGAHTHVAARH